MTINSVVYSFPFALSVMMMGCGADGLDANTGQPGEATQTADSRPKSGSGEGLDLNPAAPFRWGSWHGSFGGSFNGSVFPGLGWAFQVKSGGLVDALRVAYYNPPLDPPGSQVDNSRYSSDPQNNNPPAYGGTGGGWNSWDQCPWGQAIIGFQGASGLYIDRLGVICSNANNPNPFDSSNYIGPVHGGGGGGYFQEVCPAGYLLYGLDVRSGVYLDGFQIICRKAH